MAQQYAVMAFAFLMKAGKRLRLHTTPSLLLKNHYFSSEIIVSTLGLNEHWMLLPCYVAPHSLWPDSGRLLAVANMTNRSWVPLHWWARHKVAEFMGLTLKDYRLSCSQMYPCLAILEKHSLLVITL